MAHRVRVFVRPKKGILDPQGKAVEGALKSMGYSSVKELRVGKLIEFNVDGNAPSAKVEATVREMSEKLLSNPIIEQYAVEIEPLTE